MKRTEALKEIEVNVLFVCTACGANEPCIVSTGGLDPSRCLFGGDKPDWKEATK